MKNIHRHVKHLAEEVWKNKNIFTSTSKYNLQYKKIIDLVKKELDKNPDDIVALTNLGGAYCDIGQYKSAQVPLKKAIELGSKDANT